MDRKDSQHNISGLSFRDLSVDSEQSNQEGDFIFLDGDISNDADLSRFRKVFRFIAEKFNTRKGLAAFLIDFIEYIFSRLRIVWVLTSVLFDIFFDNLLVYLYFLYNVLCDISIPFSYDCYPIQ